VAWPPAAQTACRRAGLLRRRILQQEPRARRRNKPDQHPFAVAARRSRHSGRASTLPGRDCSCVPHQLDTLPESRRDGRPDQRRLGSQLRPAAARAPCSPPSAACGRGDGVGARPQRRPPGVRRLRSTNRDQGGRRQLLGGAIRNARVRGWPCSGLGLVSRPWLEQLSDWREIGRTLDLLPTSATHKG